MSLLPKKSLLDYIRSLSNKSSKNTEKVFNFKSLENKLSEMDALLYINVSSIDSVTLKKLSDINLICEDIRFHLNNGTNISTFTDFINQVHHLYYGDSKHNEDSRSKTKISNDLNLIESITRNSRQVNKKAHSIIKKAKEITENNLGCSVEDAICVDDFDVIIKRLYESEIENVMLTNMVKSMFEKSNRASNNTEIDLSSIVKTAPNLSYILKMDYNKWSEIISNNPVNWNDNFNGIGKVRKEIIENTIIEVDPMAEVAFLIMFYKLTNHDFLNPNIIKFLDKNERLITLKNIDKVIPRIEAISYERVCPSFTLKTYTESVIRQMIYERNEREERDDLDDLDDLGDLGDLDPFDNYLDANFPD